jgi:flagellar biosynthesis/type III secretory pathway protein FliH
MVCLEQLLNPEMYDRGYREGFEEGLEEGILKGLRAFLLPQLVRRFGDLPESVTQRVAAASAEELMLWTERIVAAASLDDVFAAA